MNLFYLLTVYKVDCNLNIEEVSMDLSEVYLRQIDENLKRQLELQEKQIEILTEIDRTNKEMESYIKSINNTKY